MLENTMVMSVDCPKEGCKRKIDITVAYLIDESNKIIKMSIRPNGGCSRCGSKYVLFEGGSAKFRPLRSDD